jgi:hypothetical protein
MTKLSMIALVLVLGCRSHSDRGKNDRPSVTLPVPTKLPPVGSATAKPGEDHAASIDNEYATLLAMYKAPTGATPCESAYLAIMAERDAAKELKRDSVFAFVAAKPDFLKLCAAQNATIQQCLVPKYQSQHGQECEGAKPADADLAKLYVLRQDLEPPKEAGQLPQQ